MQPAEASSMAGCAEVLDDLGGEEILSAKSSNKEEALFDETMGHIQDILLDDKFTEMQRGFMDKHYHHFEDVEENKFIYTDIFKEYTELIETHLESELKLRIPGFVMKFMKTLESHKDEIGEEIFDMLLSFSDFLTFKQMFLDYKAEREGTALDLGGLVVNSLAAETKT